jgi:DNA-binding NtrC family response regulator
MAAMILQESGYTVNCAANGVEALSLWKLNHDRIDLVVTDMQMPGKDGAALMQEVKEYDQNLPVVIITAYAEVDKAVAAMQAGAWATIPGSGPEGIDPWAMLSEAAAKGDPSGVRVARAMQALIAGNSGATDIVEAAIQAHAASIDATPTAPEWALLDRYAWQVTRHESDRIWMQAEGHRTERFGALPTDTALPIDDVYRSSSP